MENNERGVQNNPSENRSPKSDSYDGECVSAELKAFHSSCLGINDHEGNLLHSSGRASPIESPPDVGRPYVPVETLDIVDGIRPSNSKTRAVVLLPAIEESVDEDAVESRGHLDSASFVSSTSLPISPNLKVRQTSVQRVSSKPTLTSISEELIVKRYDQASGEGIDQDDNQSLSDHGGSEYMKLKRKKTKPRASQPFLDQRHGDAHTPGRTHQSTHVLELSIDALTSYENRRRVAPFASSAAGEGLIEHNTKSKTVEISSKDASILVSSSVRHAKGTESRSETNDPPPDSEGLQETSDLPFRGEAAKASTDTDDISICNPWSDSFSILKDLARYRQDTNSTEETSGSGESSKQDDVTKSDELLKSDTIAFDVSSDKELYPQICATTTPHPSPVSDDIPLTSSASSQEIPLPSEWRAGHEESSETAETIYCCIGEEQVVPLRDLLGSTVRASVASDSSVYKHAAYLASLNIYVNQIVLGSLCEVIVQLAMKKAAQDVDKVRKMSKQESENKAPGAEDDRDLKPNFSSLRPKGSGSDSMLAEAAVNIVDTSTPRESHSDHTSVFVSAEKQDKDFKDKEVNKQRDKDTACKQRGRERERNKRKRDREERGNSSGKKSHRNAVGDVRRSDVNPGAGERRTICTDSHNQEVKSTCRLSHLTKVVPGQQQTHDRELQDFHVAREKTAGSANRADNSGDISDSKTSCGLEYQIVTSLGEEFFPGSNCPNRARSRKSDTFGAQGEDDKSIDEWQGNLESSNKLLASRFGKRTSLYRPKQSSSIDAYEDAMSKHETGDDNDTSHCGMAGDIPQGVKDSQNVQEGDQHQINDHIIVQDEQIENPNTDNSYMYSDTTGVAYDDFYPHQPVTAWNKMPDSLVSLSCSVYDESFNHPPKYPAEHMTTDLAVDTASESGRQSSTIGENIAELKVPIEGELEISPDDADSFAEQQDNYGSLDHHQNYEHSAKRMKNIGEEIQTLFHARRHDQTDAIYDNTGQRGDAVVEKKEENFIQEMAIRNPSASRQLTEENVLFPKIASALPPTEEMTMHIDNNMPKGTDSDMDDMNDGSAKTPNTSPVNVMPIGSEGQLESGHRDEQDEEKQRDTVAHGDYADMSGPPEQYGPQSVEELAEKHSDNTEMHERRTELSILDHIKTQDIVSEPEDPKDDTYDLCDGFLKKNDVLTLTERNVTRTVEISLNSEALQAEDRNGVQFLDGSKNGPRPEEEAEEHFSGQISDSVTVSVDHRDKQIVWLSPSEEHSFRDENPLAMTCLNPMETGSSVDALAQSQQNLEKDSEQKSKQSTIADAEKEDASAVASKEGTSIDPIEHSSHIETNGHMGNREDIEHALLDSTETGDVQIDSKQTESDIVKLWRKTLQDNQMTCLIEVTNDAGPIVQEHSSDIQRFNAEKDGMVSLNELSHNEWESVTSYEKDKSKDSSPAMGQLAPFGNTDEHQMLCVRHTNIDVVDTNSDLKNLNRDNDRVLELLESDVDKVLEKESSVDRVDHTDMNGIGRQSEIKELLDESSVSIEHLLQPGTETIHQDIVQIVGVSELSKTLSDIEQANDVCAISELNQDINQVKNDVEMDLAKDPLGVIEEHLGVEEMNDLSETFKEHQEIKQMKDLSEDLAEHEEMDNEKGRLEIFGEDKGVDQVKDLSETHRIHQHEDQVEDISKTHETHKEVNQMNVSEASIEHQEMHHEKDVLEVGAVREEIDQMKVNYGVSKEYEELDEETNKLIDGCIDQINEALEDSEVHEKITQIKGGAEDAKVHEEIKETDQAKDVFQDSKVHEAIEETDMMKDFFHCSKEYEESEEADHIKNVFEDSKQHEKIAETGQTKNVSQKSEVHEEIEEITQIKDVFREIKVHEEIEETALVKDAFEYSKAPGETEETDQMKFSSKNFEAYEDLIEMDQMSEKREADETNGKVVENLQNTFILYEETEQIKYASKISRADENLGQLETPSGTLSNHSETDQLNDLSDVPNEHEEMSQLMDVSKNIEAHQENHHMKDVSELCQLHDECSVGTNPEISAQMHIVADTYEKDGSLTTGNIQADLILGSSMQQNRSEIEHARRGLDHDRDENKPNYDELAEVELCSDVPAPYHTKTEAYMEDLENVLGFQHDTGSSVNRNETDLRLPDVTPPTLASIGPRYKIESSVDDSYKPKMHGSESIPCEKIGVHQMQRGQEKEDRRRCDRDVLEQLENAKPTPASSVDQPKNVIDLEYSHHGKSFENLGDEVNLREERGFDSKVTIDKVVDESTDFNPEIKMGYICTEDNLTNIENKIGPTDSTEMSDVVTGAREGGKNGLAQEPRTDMGGYEEHSGRSVEEKEDKGRKEAEMVHKELFDANSQIETAVDHVDMKVEVKTYQSIETELHDHDTLSQELTSAQERQTVHNLTYDDKNYLETGNFTDDNGLLKIEVDQDKIPTTSDDRVVEHTLDCSKMIQPDKAELLGEQVNLYETHTADNMNDQDNQIDQIKETWHAMVGFEFTVVPDEETYDQMEVPGNMTDQMDAEESLPDNSMAKDDLIGDVNKITDVGYQDGSQINQPIELTQEQENTENKTTLKPTLKTTTVHDENETRLILKNDQISLNQAEISELRHDLGTAEEIVILYPEMHGNEHEGAKMGMLNGGVERELTHNDRRGDFNYIETVRGEECITNNIETTMSELKHDTTTEVGETLHTEHAADNKREGVVDMDGIDVEELNKDELTEALDEQHDDTVHSEDNGGTADYNMIQMERAGIPEVPNQFPIDSNDETHFDNKAYNEDIKIISTGIIGKLEDHTTGDEIVEELNKETSAKDRRVEQLGNIEQTTTITLENSLMVKSDFLFERQIGDSEIQLENDDVTPCIMEEMEPCEELIAIGGELILAPDEGQNDVINQNEEGLNQTKFGMNQLESVNDKNVEEDFTIDANKELSAAGQANAMESVESSHTPNSEFIFDSTQDHEHLIELHTDTPHLEALQGQAPDSGLGTSSGVYLSAHAGDTTDVNEDINVFVSATDTMLVHDTSTYPTESAEYHVDQTVTDQDKESLDNPPGGSFESGAHPFVPHLTDTPSIESLSKSDSESLQTEEAETKKDDVEVGEAQCPYINPEHDHKDNKNTTEDVGKAIALSAREGPDPFALSELDYKDNRDEDETNGKTGGKFATHATATDKQEPHQRASEKMVPDLYHVSMDSFQNAEQAGSQPEVGEVNSPSDQVSFENVERIEKLAPPCPDNDEANSEKIAENTALDTSKQCAEISLSSSYEVALDHHAQKTETPHNSSVSSDSSSQCDNQICLQENGGDTLDQWTNSDTSNAEEGAYARVPIQTSAINEGDSYRPALRIMSDSTAHKETGEKLPQYPGTKTVPEVSKDERENLGEVQEKIEKIAKEASEKILYSTISTEQPEIEQTEEKHDQREFQEEKLHEKKLHEGEITEQELYMKEQQETEFKGHLQSEINEHLKDLHTKEVNEREQDEKEFYEQQVHVMEHEMDFHGDQRHELEDGEQHEEKLRMINQAEMARYQDQVRNERSEEAQLVKNFQAKFHEKEQNYLTSERGKFHEKEEPDVKPHEENLYQIEQLDVERREEELHEKEPVHVEPHEEDFQEKEQLVITQEGEKLLENANVHKASHEGFNEEEQLDMEPHDEGFNDKERLDEEPRKQQLQEKEQLDMEPHEEELREKEPHEEDFHEKEQLVVKKHREQVREKVHNHVAPHEKFHEKEQLDMESQEEGFLEKEQLGMESQEEGFHEKEQRHMKPQEEFQEKVKLDTESHEEEYYQKQRSDMEQHGEEFHEKEQLDMVPHEEEFHEKEQLIVEPHEEFHEKEQLHMEPHKEDFQEKGQLDMEQHDEGFHEKEQLDLGPHENEFQEEEQLDMKQNEDKTHEDKFHEEELLHVGPHDEEFREKEQLDKERQGEEFKEKKQLDMESHGEECFEQEQSDMEPHQEELQREKHLYVEHHAEDILEREQLDMEPHEDEFHGKEQIDMEPHEGEFHKREQLDIAPYEEEFHQRGSLDIELHKEKFHEKEWLDIEPQEQKLEAYEEEFHEKVLLATEPHEIEFHEKDQPEMEPPEEEPVDVEPHEEEFHNKEQLDMAEHEEKFHEKAPVHVASHEKYHKKEQQDMEPSEKELHENKQLDMEPHEQETHQKEQLDIKQDEEKTHHKAELDIEPHEKEFHEKEQLDMKSHEEEFHKKEQLDMQLDEKEFHETEQPDMEPNEEEFQENEGLDMKPYEKLHEKEQLHVKSHEKEFHKKEQLDMEDHAIKPVQVETHEEEFYEKEQLDIGPHGENVHEKELLHVASYDEIHEKEQLDMEPYGDGFHDKEAAHVGPDEEDIYMKKRLDIVEYSEQIHEKVPVHIASHEEFHEKEQLHMEQHEEEFHEKEQLDIEQHEEEYHEREHLDLEPHEEEFREKEQLDVELHVEEFHGEEQLHMKQQEEDFHQKEHLDMEQDDKEFQEKEQLDMEPHEEEFHEDEQLTIRPLIEEIQEEEQLEVESHENDFSEKEQLDVEPHEEFHDKEQLNMEPHEREFHEKERLDMELHEEELRDEKPLLLKLHVKEFYETEQLDIKQHGEQLSEKASIHVVRHEEFCKKEHLDMEALKEEFKEKEQLDMKPHEQEFHEKEQTDMEPHEEELHENIQPDMEPYDKEIHEKEQLDIEPQKKEFHEKDDEDRLQMELHKTDIHVKEQLDMEPQEDELFEKESVNVEPYEKECHEKEQLAMETHEEEMHEIKQSDMKPYEEKLHEEEPVHLESHDEEFQEKGHLTVEQHEEEEFHKKEQLYMEPHEEELYEKERLVIEPHEEELHEKVPVHVESREEKLHEKEQPEMGQRGKQFHVKTPVHEKIHEKEKLNNETHEEEFEKEQLKMNHEEEEIHERKQRDLEPYEEQPHEKESVRVEPPEEEIDGKEQPDKNPHKEDIQEKELITIKLHEGEIYVKKELYMEPHEGDFHEKGQLDVEPHEEELHETKAVCVELHEEEFHEKEQVDMKQHEQQFQEKRSVHVKSNKEFFEKEQLYMEPHAEEFLEKRRPVMEAHEEELQEKKQPDTELHEKEVHEKEQTDMAPYEQEFHDKKLDMISHEEEFHEKEQLGMEPHEKELYEKETAHVESHEEDFHEKEQLDMAQKGSKIHEEEQLDVESHEEKSQEKEQLDIESHEENFYEKELIDFGPHEKESYQKEQLAMESHEEEFQKKEQPDMKPLEEEFHEKEQLDMEPHEEEIHEKGQYGAEPCEEEVHEKEAFHIEPHEGEFHLKENIDLEPREEELREKERLGLEVYDEEQEWKNGKDYYLDKHGMESQKNDMQLTEPLLNERTEKEHTEGVEHEKRQTKMNGATQITNQNDQEKFLRLTEMQDKMRTQTALVNSPVDEESEVSVLISVAESKKETENIAMAVEDGEAEDIMCPETECVGIDKTIDEQLSVHAEGFPWEDMYPNDPQVKKTFDCHLQAILLSAVIPFIDRPSTPIIGDGGLMVKGGDVVGEERAGDMYSVERAQDDYGYLRGASPLHSLPKTEEKLSRETKDGRRRVKKGVSEKLVKHNQDVSHPPMNDTARSSTTVPLSKHILEKSRSADECGSIKDAEEEEEEDEGHFLGLRPTRSSPAPAGSVRKIKVVDVEVFPKDVPSIYHPVPRDPVPTVAMTNLNYATDKSSAVQRPQVVRREKKSSLWKRLKTILRPPKLVRRDGKFTFVKKYKQNANLQTSVLVEGPPSMVVDVKSDQSKSKQTDLLDRMHPQQAEADHGRGLGEAAEYAITAWHKSDPPQRALVLRNKSAVKRYQWRRFRRLRVLRHSVERMGGRMPAMKKHSVSSKNYVRVPESTAAQTAEEHPAAPPQLRRAPSKKRRSRRRREFLPLEHSRDSEAMGRCELVHSASPEVFEVFCSEDEEKGSTERKVEPAVGLLMTPSPVKPSKSVVSESSGGTRDVVIPASSANYHGKQSLQVISSNTPRPLQRPSSTRRWPCSMM